MIGGLEVVLGGRGLKGTYVVDLAGRDLPS